MILDEIEKGERFFEEGDGVLVKITQFRDWNAISAKDGTYSVIPDRELVIGLI